MGPPQNKSTFLPAYSLPFLDISQWHSLKYLPCPLHSFTPLPWLFTYGDNLAKLNSNYSALTCAVQAQPQAMCLFKHGGKFFDFRFFEFLMKCEHHANMCLRLVSSTATWGMCTFFPSLNQITLGSGPLLSMACMSPLTPQASSWPVTWWLVMTIHCAVSWPVVIHILIDPAGTLTISVTDVMLQATGQQHGHDRS